MRCENQLTYLFTYLLNYVLHTITIGIVSSDILVFEKDLVLVFI